MQTEIIVNGVVSLLLIPDNEMEEQMLHQLMKQTNSLTEIRSSVIVLSKTFKSGILIGPESNKREEPKKETEIKSQE